jgi:hypothetical protein
MMCLLRVAFIFNMVVSKTEVVLYVRQFQIRLLADAEQFRHMFHESGEAKMVGITIKLSMTHVYADV